ncbi:hypothetical protein LTR17_026390 [Elasticomyces elasticus]|nr:hypothetical protein LTR17_026390 [Elasticomyces elasticus]
MARISPRTPLPRRRQAGRTSVSREGTGPIGLYDSLERVVKEAHQSICNDRVNVFDQARINSFLQRPRAADRPLMVKLQRSTWRTYTRIWQLLLCFIYRTSQPGHPKAYRHQLTTQQAVCLAAVYHFTPTLSGFIEIAIMLVIQKAVSAVQAGVAEHPADLLDEMRARFLLHSTRSPFSWASRLRMYGKKVHDSTTCLGYISWSEDNQAVSYKAVHCLGIDASRDNVAMAQEQLEGLLLMHP